MATFRLEKHEKWLLRQAFQRENFTKCWIMKNYFGLTPSNNFPDTCFIDDGEYHNKHNKAVVTYYRMINSLKEKGLITTDMGDCWRDKNGEIIHLTEEGKKVAEGLISKS